MRKTTEIVAENKTTHAQTVVSQTSESYLIDAYNHTGYAQVLESVTDTGKVTSYTIGDDVLSQTFIASAPLPLTSYLLADGHGSTRQLTDALGAVTAQYSYDSYGLMLGTQSGSQPLALTSLLYCGEQFDASLQMYNLRARHYDPSNGRFNRLDPFAGSQFDPQSLHKYAYCHSDPVNNVDPSGEMSLVGMMAVVSILAGLSTIAYLTLVKDTSLSNAIMWGVIAAISTAVFLYYGVQIAAYLAGIMFGSMAGALFVCAFMAFGLQSSLVVLQEIGYVLAGKEYSWQQKAAAAMFLSLLLTLSVSSHFISSDGNVKIPQDALAKAKPTSGHPNQLMYELDDGGKVLFRKDFGTESHSVGGPLKGQGDINHYNIQLQNANGKTIKNFHIAPDGKGGYISW